MNILDPKKYRVTLDPSWASAGPEERRTARQWYELIPCSRGGMIYLVSDDPVTLACYLPSTRRARNIAETVPGVRLDLMDGEAVIYFGPGDLDLITSLAGARRRRRLSPEAKARAAERIKPYQFKGRSDAVESEFAGQI